MKKYCLLILLMTLTSNLFCQKIIIMEHDNGIYKIPCKVNGIPMKFIFDTGASDVSISLTEASFLIKQGLITEKEILGNVKYQIANGDIKEGTKLVLKEINISGILLKNVSASIVHEQNAPLLLGQSAISRLGKIQIQGEKLTIYPKYDSNVFLNIDLTKTITDFGYSAVLNLTKELNPCRISDIIPNNNHFLKDFNFDSEIIVFNKKGDIVFIILKKIYEKGSFTDYQLSDYNKLIIKLEDKYGESTSKKERVTEWKNDNLNLVLNKSPEKENILIFQNKVRNNNTIDYLTDSNIIQNKENLEYSRKNKNLRLGFVSYLNVLFELSKKETITQSAQIRNNDLIIRTIIDFDKSAYYEFNATEKRKKTSLIFSLYTLNSILKEKDLKNSIFLLGTENIKFINEFNYLELKKEIDYQSINIKSLENLNTPITSEKFTELIK